MKKLINNSSILTLIAVLFVSAIVSTSCQKDDSLTGTVYVIDSTGLPLNNARVVLYHPQALDTAHTIVTTIKDTSVIANIGGVNQVITIKDTSLAVRIDTLYNTRAGDVTYEKRTDAAGTAVFEDIKLPIVFTVRAEHPQIVNRFVVGSLILNEPGASDDVTLRFR